jgi:hypothetical protein
MKELSEIIQELVDSSNSMNQIDSKTAITESKQTNKPKLNEGRVVTGNKDNQTNDVDVETALKRLRQLAGNN